MTKAEKGNLLKQNTLCWLAALVAPLILHFGVSDTKFPWLLILPSPARGADACLEQVAHQGERRGHGRSESTLAGE